MADTKVVSGDIQVLGTAAVARVLNCGQKKARGLLSEGKIRSWRIGNGPWQTTEQYIRDYLHELQKGPK